VALDEILALLFYGIWRVPYHACNESVVPLTYSPVVVGETTEVKPHMTRL
jgi:hypothetical protein